MGLVNFIYQGLIIPPEPAKRKDGFYRLKLDREWLVKKNVARFYIRDTIVAALDNHNFGTYAITMHRYPSGSNFSVVGEDHPHAIGGGICWGDLHTLAHTFLGQNDAENFAGIAEALLRSYNPERPYGGWWSERYTCHECGGIIYGRGNIRRCLRCSVDLCPVCAVKCEAGWFFCSHCYCHRLSCKVVSCDKRPPRIAPEPEIRTRSMRREDIFVSTSGSTDGEWAWEGLSVSGPVQPIEESGGGDEHAEVDDDPIGDSLDVDPASQGDSDTLPF